MDDKGAFSLSLFFLPPSVLVLEEYVCNQQTDRPSF